MSIILYDIPSKVKGCAWTPNPLKARFALGYKSIPFATTWVEYPDIAALYKKLGVNSTAKASDGSPHYTLPLLQDTSTGAIISDSLLIIEYLDKTYPSTPKIAIAPHPMNAAFLAAYSAAMQSTMVSLLLPRVPAILHETSEEYFERTRKVMLGKPLAQLYAGKEGVESAEYKNAWVEFEKGLGTVAKWCGDYAYLGGDKPSFGDIQVVSTLVFTRILYGEDSAEWKNVMSWDGGRWGRLVQELNKYMVLT